MQFCYSQSYYYNASAYYDDSYSQWNISAVDSLEEELEEELFLKWPNRNDWTQWTWNTENDVVYLEQKWKNKVDQWELRGSDGTVSMKIKWRNDATNWTIQHGDYKINWKTVSDSDAGHWALDHKEYGYFEMYNTYEGDSRDWVIIDECLLPTYMKQAMIFTVIRVTTPSR